EDHDRRAGARRREHVERLDGRGAIREAPRRAESRAHGVCGRCAPCDDLLLIRRPLRLVIGAIERSLVVVEEDLTGSAHCPRRSSRKYWCGSSLRSATRRRPARRASRRKRVRGIRARGGGPNSESSFQSTLITRAPRGSSAASRRKNAGAPWIWWYALMMIATWQRPRGSSGSSSRL